MPASPVPFNALGAIGSIGRACSRAVAALRARLGRAAAPTGKDVGCLPEPEARVEDAYFLVYPPNMDVGGEWWDESEPTGASSLDDPRRLRAELRKAIWQASDRKVERLIALGAPLDGALAWAQACSKNRPVLWRDIFDALRQAKAPFDDVAQALEIGDEGDVLGCMRRPGFTHADFVYLTGHGSFARLLGREAVRAETLRLLGALDCRFARKGSDRAGCRAGAIFQNAVRDEKLGSLFCMVVEINGFMLPRRRGSPYHFVMAHPDSLDWLLENVDSSAMLRKDAGKRDALARMDAVMECPVSMGRLDPERREQLLHARAKMRSIAERLALSGAVSGDASEGQATGSKARRL